MYASVRLYNGVTDPGEAGRRITEGFVPLISDIEGLVAYFEVDAGNGVMASISVFEDKAGADASNERAAGGPGRTWPSWFPTRRRSPQVRWWRARRPEHPPHPRRVALPLRDKERMRCAAETHRCSALEAAGLRE